MKIEKHFFKYWKRYPQYGGQEKYKRIHNGYYHITSVFAR